MCTCTARKTIEEAAAEEDQWRREKEETESRKERDFDEKAWLRGQKPVWGGCTDAIKGLINSEIDNSRVTFKTIVV